MPSYSVNSADSMDLRNAVRSALSSFAKNGRDYDDDDDDDVGGGGGASTIIDVYRAMRDVSNLLFEERAVCDALDSDPFGIAMRRGRRRRIGDGGSASDDDDDDDDDDDVDGDDGDGNEGNGDDGEGEDDDDDDDDDEDASEKRKNGKVIARVKVRGRERGYNPPFVFVGTDLLSSFRVVAHTSCSKSNAIYMIIC